MGIRTKRAWPAAALAIVLWGTMLWILGGPPARPAPPAPSTAVPIIAIPRFRTLARGDLLSALAGGADGTVYFGGYNLFLAYNAAQQSVIALPHPLPPNVVLHSLTLAPNGRIYGLAVGPGTRYFWSQRFSVERLFVYDPQLRETRVLEDEASFQRGRAQVVAASSERIYLFQEHHWQAFYDSSKGKLWGSRLGDVAEEASGARQAWQEGPVTLGLDGLLYAGYRLERKCPSTVTPDADTCRDLAHREPPRYALMAFDPRYFESDFRYTTSLTVEVPGPLQALAPRPGGGVYLSTQTETWAGTLWSYDPLNRALTPLPLPSGIAPFATVALATSDDGRLYGIGQHQASGSQAIESFLFAYPPDLTLFEQLASLPGGGRGVLLAMPGDRLYLLWHDQLLLYQP